MKPGEDVIEATYRNGLVHGLVRSIAMDRVTVSLITDGWMKRLAMFEFNGDFEELCREGTELDDLVPDYFNPAIADPQPLRRVEEEIGNDTVRG